MRVKEVKLYRFDELSDEAKDKARDWYRQGNYEDNYWSEFVIEDAATIAELMGVNVRQRPVKLMNGTTWYEPSIYWSGFSSQGDGACFEGRYSYKKGSVKAVKDHVPKDEKLHRIVEGLAQVQRRYWYQAGVEVSHKGHYQHAMCTEFRDTGDRELSNEDYETVKELLRDFMCWIYRQLESEYEYVNSDEQVDESIRANEYEFDEEGRRA